MKTKQPMKWHVGLGLMLAATVACLAPLQAEAAYTGTGNFTLITSASDITDGGYYVFVGGSAYWGTAMGTKNSTANILHIATGYPTAASTIVNPPATNVWRIDGNSTCWNIYSETVSYFIGANSSANSIVTAASTTAQYGWTFATTVSSAFIAKNVGYSSRMLMYNSGTPRFAAYTSTANVPIRLYKMAAASSGTLAVDNTGNPAASTVYRSDTGKLVFGFKLTASGGSVSFTAVKLTRTLGSGAQANDFTNYKLYYDSNNDGSASGETQLSTTQSDGSTITFSSISSQSIADGASRRYLVTADVASGAVKGGTMNLKINANGDVTSDATSITSSAPYPSSAIDHTVGNQTPTASGQTVAADEDVDETITLAGSDSDGDTLTYKITTLPAAGKLYQTADGTTKGDEITSTPTTVSDTSHRVIYVTAANGNGSGYGNFGFKVNDTTIDSSEATVTVNVTAVSDAPVISVNPAISGTATVGETLSTTSGTWTRPANPAGTITYSYQWYRDDDNVAGGETQIGSDQNSYLLVAGDSGKYIKVVVTATENSEAGTPAASAYVGPVSAAGRPSQWTKLYNSGQPVYTYYLGDSLLYVYEFGINTDTTGWEIKYGIGKSTSGSGWTWRDAEWSRMDGSYNRVWKSKASEQLFDSTGNWYIAGRFVNGSYIYYAADGDGTTVNETLDATNYFAVGAINNPSAQTAAAGASAPASTIDLDWTRNAQSHGVMIVRKLTTESWTEPTQGTEYSAPGTLGDGDIVYKGAGTDFTDTGLAADTTYDYKFYSVNNDYYSAGVTAQGTTDVCEPDAPTGLYASATNDTGFTASWTAPAAGNPPTNYYIDVSTSSTFSVAAAPKSTLAAGDIAIIGANFDDPDQFTFVALVDIADGTKIYFTDNGWTNDHIKATEGVWIWSNSTAAAIAAGTMVTMTNNYASTGSFISGGGSWALSASGDQILAYQVSGATTTMIYAVNSEGTGWQTGNIDSNTSELPTGLANGTTAMAIDEIDNFVYGMGTVSGSQSALLAAIGNKANWSGSDSIRETLPPAGSFSVTAASTPSYVTGYQNLSVGNVTSFAVTGLDPETTYYFRVRGEGATSCVGADSTTANETTLAEVIPEYWTLLRDRGTPWKTYTLGDTLAEQFQFAINTDTTGWDVEWGHGTSTDGSGWTWTDATYVSNNVNDRYWTSPANTLQLTAVGDWYYAGRFTSLVPYTYYAAGDWTTANLTLSAASYVTVEAIADPTDQTATRNGTEPTTQIDLAWTLNAADNEVMVVRKLSTASWTEPVQGTGYAVDNTIGAGTVVFFGYDTGFADTGLADGTTYDYKFYSINNNYYSPGVTAQASTLACEPDVPTGLYASDTNSSGFTASWTAPAAGNPPTNYFLDVSTEADFATGGGGGLFISEVANPSDVANAKFVELYNATGSAIDFGASTWYLWRQANGGTSWTNVQLSGTIAANGTHVLATSTTYDSSYGQAADQYSSITISGNGNDGYFLVQGGTAEAMGTVVDAYGVIDENGTGKAWEYTSGHAVRNGEVALPNSTWTASEWTITKPATTAAMSPDAHTCTGGGTPSYVPGYENLLLGNVTSADVTGLCPNRTYYFRVRAQGAESCTGANSNTGSVTTLKGVLTVTGATADDKPYDGGTDATISGATLVGVLCGDDVSLDSLAGTFASANAGTAIAVTAGLTLKGAGAGNYELTQPTGLSADINAKELTVDGAMAVDKDYDGTPDAAISGASLVGVVGGDDVSLDALAGTFASANAGMDIAVTAALTLMGPDMDNYYLTQPTGLTADINPLAVTIYPNAGQSKVYGSLEPKFFLFTVSTPLVGDDEFTGDLGRATGETVGFYDYTLGDLGAGANYELSLGGTAQFEITAKELTVDGAAADDKPYDGGTDATISGASLVGVEGSDDVSLDSLAGTFAQAGVGTDIAVTAALTLTGADAGNYYLTQPTGLMADITAKELTVTGATADDKPYDGGTDATISGASLVGVVGLDDVSLDALAGTFAQAGVGTDIAVTAALTLQGADAGNYYLTQPTGLMADINAKELTVTGAAADDKPYDGGTAATISGASLVGVVGLDDVSLDALVGTFAQAGVGTDIAVTAALTLQGADAGNYTLTQPTGLMADIYKATQTITFEGGAWQHKTYGDAPFEITATANSGLTVTFESSDETVATVNSPVTIVGAGTTTITAKQPGDANWNEAIVVQRDLDVDPLAVTITPTAGQSKFEGDPDPAFTYSPAPALVGSDAFSGALARAPGEAIGFYAYDLGTLSVAGHADDYDLSLSGSSDQFEIKAPTGVVLYYFVAGYENGQVVLRWRTASEEDTVGFWVERLAGDAWVRLNDAIIYGKDQMGAKYDLVDAGAELGGTYTYQVVEEQTDGSQQVYGPFVRTISALSFPEVDPITVTPDGVLIRWLSRVDEVYKVLRSADLTQGFETISSGIAATPPENEYLDKDAGGIGMYMIQVDDE